MPTSSLNRADTMNSAISAIISKALDGLALRSQVTAHNIANVNSEGFRPLSVSFEAALREAAANGEEAVRALQLSIEETDARETPGVRMDLELATQSETALRYGALVDVLARQLQLQRAVIRGGQ